MNKKLKISANRGLELEENGGVPLGLILLIHLSWYICVLTVMCAHTHVWGPEVNHRYHSSRAIELLF